MRNPTRRAILASQPAGSAGDRARAEKNRTDIPVSSRGRRSHHQDHRRLRQRVRTGKPRHQPAADLRRQLHRYPDQGTDLDERRRTAASRGAAGRRCIQPDRPGRHRAVRHPGQFSRRQSLAQQLLSGLHGQRDDRRTLLGHPVPALDDRAVLEQGRLPRRRTQPGHATRHLAGARSLRAETDETRGNGNIALGRRNTGHRLHLLAVPGAGDRGRGNACHAGRQKDQLRSAGSGGRHCNTGWIWRSAITRIRRGWSSGAPRHATSWRARPR